jgi:hypothetical protein
MLTGVTDLSALSGNVAADAAKIFYGAVQEGYVQVFAGTLAG